MTSRRHPGSASQDSGVIGAYQLAAVTARIEGVNPAELTQQINAIMMRLLDLAQAKTKALAAARHVDLEALQPSLNKMAANSTTTAGMTTAMASGGGGD